LGETSTLGHWTTGLARSSKMGSVAVSTAQTVFGSRQSGLTSTATSVGSVEVGQIAKKISQQNTFGSGLLGSSANIGFMGGHVVVGSGQSIPVMGHEG
jgi:prepilin-type processing-associated H-X9-DG protein